MDLFEQRLRDVLSDFGLRQARKLMKEVNYALRVMDYDLSETEESLVVELLVCISDHNENTIE